MIAKKNWSENSAGGSDENFRGKWDYFNVLLKF